MKHRLKKSLSVFLSIIMAMTCFSMLCPVWVSALDATTAKNNLYTALKAVYDAGYGGIGGSSSAAATANTNGFGYTYTAPSETGTITLSITDTTADGLIYKAAVAFAEFLNSDIIRLGYSSSTVLYGENGLYWWSRIYYEYANDSSQPVYPYRDMIALFCNMKLSDGKIRTAGFTKDNQYKGLANNVGNATSLTVTVTRSELAALRDYANTYNGVGEMPNDVNTTLTYGMNGIRGGSVANYYHYFSTSKGIGYTTSNAITTILKNYYNYFFNGVLIDGTDPFALTDAQLTTLMSNNSSRVNAVNNISGITAADIAKFFPQNQLVKDFLADCDEAASLSAYKVDVDYYHAAGGFIDGVNAGTAYDPLDITGMWALWAAQQVHYDRIMSLSSRAIAALGTRYGLNMTQVETARAKLWKDISLYELVALKAEIEPWYDQYYRENFEDYLDVEQFSDGLLAGLVGRFKGYNDLLTSYYNPDAVVEVFGDYANDVKSLYNKLKYAALYRDINYTAYDHFSYYNAILYGNYDKVSSADIISKLNEAEARYVTYQSDRNAAMNSGLTPEDFAAIYDFDPMDAIERLYIILEARLEEEVAIAMELYGGRDIGKLTWQNFSEVKRLIGMIETEIFDRLKYTAYISEDTRIDYDILLNAILNEYKEFMKNPMPYYEQTIPDYPVREPYPDDFARSGDQDYEVDRQKLQNVVDGLDKILISNAFGDLTGLDIGELINGLLEDNLYSDSIINMLVSMIYPLILTEFENVWAGLPPSMKDNSIDVSVNVTPLHNVLADTTATNTMRSLALYPDLLASAIGNTTFTKAYNTLISATQTWGTGVSNIWSHPSLYDTEGNFYLDWGVDKPVEGSAFAQLSKKERFMQALSASLQGLFPLLGALLLGKDLHVYSPHVASVSGSADSGILGIWVNITINDVYLNIDVDTGTNGYAAVLTPIFEALLGIGEDVIPTTAQLKSFTTTRQFVDAVFNPVFGFIDMLAAAPLATVLDLLPNLGAAFALDKIAPLLSELKLDLKYTPNGQIKALSGIVCMEMIDKVDLSGAVSINIGDMVLGGGDLDLGFLSDINELVGMVSGMLGDDINLPAINSGLLATYGELYQLSSKRPSGTRYYIDAEEGDVLLATLRYLLRTVKDTPELIDAIAGLLGGDSGDGGGLPDIVLEIISNATLDIDDTIAALVELFNPVEYSMKEYNWVEPDSSEPIYLTTYYVNGWTKQKADNIAGSLNDIVDAVLKMANVDLDISETLDNLINGLFTPETLKSLTDILAGLQLDDSIKGILKDLLGVDLSAWDIYDENYDFGFTGADRDAFMAEIYKILAPLAPALLLLLNGEDITLLDEITIMGYEGYAYGVIPLLEALGCAKTDILTPAEYDSAINDNQINIIKAIVDPIFKKIDAIINNPIDEIIGMLPGLLYFLECGGLATSVSNILQPLLVLLDVARPIYNLNIQKIVSLFAPDLVIDINNLDGITINWVLELVEDMTGLELDRVVGRALREMSFKSKMYDSVNGEVYYTSSLDGGDMITILLSAVVELIHSEANRAVIEEMLNAEGILSAIINVIKDSGVNLKTINWFYFDHDFDDDDMLANPQNVNIPSQDERSLARLTYPNNWTKGTADYLATNIDSIVDMVLSLVFPDGGTLSDIINDLLSGVLDIYNDETVNALIGLVQSFLTTIDEVLIEAIDDILDTELTEWYNYPPDKVWGVTDRDSFVSVIAQVLKPIESVLNWILCGEDYTFLVGTEASVGEGENLITINGGDGYAYGLVPILEALGCDLMTASEFKAADFETKIESLLNSVFDRLYEIIDSEKPIDAILEMIPNLIYFLNADGLTVSVYNLLGVAFNVIEEISPDIVEINLDDLLGGFPISDMSLTGLLTWAEGLLNDLLSETLQGAELHLDPLIDFLEDFYFGEISHYPSASEDVAFRMDYSQDEGKKDLITILFCLVIDVFDYGNNNDAWKALIGEDLFSVIKNILNLDDFKTEMADIDWLYQDRVGERISATNGSDIFGVAYGKYWTKPKAQHVADNWEEFVDNLIYIIGIQIDGKRMKSVGDILDTLVGSTIYTQENIYAIISLIQGLIGQIDAIDTDGHIKALINESLKIDLNAWNNYDENSFKFTSGDQDAFIEALCTIVAPLNPILEWLLSDRDSEKDLAFFVDEDGKDYIVLPGAEGYAYGIIPLLEALGCKDILTPEQFMADGDNMLKNILTPLLNKLDELFASPVSGILEMLPNLIYFINSNGLDTSIKNLLNPLYTVFDAIEPLIKIDLYELIGIPLDEYDFEGLINYVIELIAGDTGYELSAPVWDAIAELTNGVVESFESKSPMNGGISYRMVYAPEGTTGDCADMVTIVLRLFFRFLVMDDNIDMVMGILKDALYLDDVSYDYVKGLLDTFALYVYSDDGMDTILGTVYEIAVVAFPLTSTVKDGLDSMSSLWAFICETLSNTSSGSMNDFYNSLMAFLNPGLADEETVLPQGLVGFFQRIAALFQKIIDFFKNLFSFG